VATEDKEVERQHMLWNDLFLRGAGQNIEGEAKARRRQGRGKGRI
jgi:hypothetical protein